MEEKSILYSGIFWPPKKPGEISFAGLAETLRKHFQATRVIIAEWFHFHRQSQAISESLSEYVAELRKLSTHCEFGQYLNEDFRDHLVCGLKSEAIQHRLLSELEANLTVF